MDLPTLRPIGVVGAGINVRISDWQRRSAENWIRTQILTVASTALLMTELSRSLVIPIQSEQCFHWASRYTLVGNR